MRRKLLLANTPSPSSHLSLFLHPLQRKEIHSTADFSLPEEFLWPSDPSALTLPKITARDLSRGFLVSQKCLPACLHAVRQVRGEWGCKTQTAHKQPWECPAIAPAALPMQRSRTWAGKIQASQRDPCVQTTASLHGTADVLGISLLWALSMFQGLKFCGCPILGPNFRTGSPCFYSGHVEIWQWNLRAWLCFHPGCVRNTGTLQKWV